MNIDFRPSGEIMDSFLLDNSFFRCVIGPVGSGKTAGSAIEIFRRACEQAPDRRGVRHSKWAAIRQTYRQLERTTIPTWRQWFTDAFGVFRWNPTPQHHIVQPLGDGTVLDLNVDFIALDGASAEADLRSLEVTGLWFHELSEIEKGVVTFALSRVGRYPAMRDGGPTWSGAIGDTNASDQDHWLHAFFTDPPKGWRFFKQPPAVLRVGDKWIPNPAAENLSHLPVEYYSRLLTGQSEDWIRVFLANEFGYAIDGKVVYPEWADSTHVAPEPLKPIDGLPIHIGLDFGLTPAAIVGQKTARGQWRIIDEFLAEDMGLVRFSELLAERIDRQYGHFGDSMFKAWGDPAGAARAQTDERTCLEIVRKHARLDCSSAPTNEFTVRREAVAGTLNRMVDGKPGFLLSPTCKVLRKGFAGGYHYKRVKVTGDDRYHDKPDKNAFSHPHDALQYLLSGGGEGRVVMKRPRHEGPRPTHANSHYSPLRHSRRVA